ncbi:hypothetical protein GCM10009861_26230 [Neomicrococcus aestuarii]
MTGWRRKKRTMGHRRRSKTSLSEGVGVADMSLAYESGGTLSRAPHTECGYVLRYRGAG